MNPAATMDPPKQSEAQGETGDDGLGNGGPPTPPANLPDDSAGGDKKPEQEAFPGLELVADRELKVTVGGRKPDAAILKLKGGKIELGKSQFERGDRLLTVATLQVTGNNDQDTIDKLSGDVKSTSRAQNATVCGIARLEDFLREKIADEELLGRVFMALDLEEED